MKLYMKSINVKIAFKLKADEKKKITSMLSKGKESVRVIKRARVLELLMKDILHLTIAKFVGVTLKR